MKTSFEAWMTQVDQACQRISGCSIHDLTDQSFDDWYEDGVSPASAARKALRNDGFGG